MSGIHIFDVDHTLIRTSTATCFLREGLDRGYYGLASLASVPLHLRRYRRGRMKDGIMEREIPFVKGLSRAELEDWGRAAFERFGKRRIFLGARELIERLKAEGARIILATSSVDILIDPIAEFLGIEERVTSRLAYEGDICTGRLESGAAFGSSKLEKTMAFMAERGLSLAAASFYSDSSFDLPLLEAVGRPVAVNPDAKLERVAISRGWAMLRFKRTLGRGSRRV